MKRRTFLQTGSIGAGAMLLDIPRIGANGSSDMIAIEAPFHGAVLNHRHGESAEGGLKIKVSGRVKPGLKAKVNGHPARVEGDRFSADVILREKETEITATAGDASGNRPHSIRVVWDRHSFPRYRFSIDDNSFFLRDVAQKGYPSLFDCFYLKMLRDLHTRFGTRYTLNVYFTTEDGFDLTKFPDRYRGEWRDNADWLKLAFHARANMPDRPYQNAPVDRLLRDLDQVAEQIHRFAGPEVYAPPTVIHWGMTPEAAFKPLYGRGVRVLSGYFALMNGVWDVNYRFDDTRSEYLSRHDALKDFESGIVFSRIDMVCNLVPVEKIAATLEPLTRDPNQAEIMDIFTHEQYFWTFYKDYIPDHPQRLETTLHWLTEHGYKPVFYHEGFLGAPE